MNEHDVKELLIGAGAILEGHFLLTSGLHSNMYIEKFQVLQHPEPTEKLCAALAARFRRYDPQVVVGPVTGGIILAYETARQLGTRAIFTERENGIMCLRRGFYIKPGERVLVVEDIITTGGSVQETIDVVRRQGGIPVGLGVLVDRSGGKAQFDVPLISLLRLEVPTFRPEECPMCREGKPFTKRGSRNI